MCDLKFSFEKGGIIYASILDENDEVTKEVLNVLSKRSINTDVIHTRWCGREIYMPIKTKNKTIDSSVTNNVNKFDLVYWKKNEEEGSDETVSIFYGAESLRHYSGPIYVKVIGKVSNEQNKLLEEIGNRVWLEGKEKVTIEIK